MATFSELKQRQKELLSNEFDESTKDIKYPTEANRRSERRRFVEAGITRWFAQRQMFESIEVVSTVGFDEIRDEWFNGSITVYGPSRQIDWEATKSLEKKCDGCVAGLAHQCEARPVYKIVPGYINASSWQAGTSGSSVLDVQQELRHRLRMMEIAITCLNQRNVTCLEWVDMENPMATLLAVQSQLARYQEREREETKKAQVRKVKKSV